VAELDAGIRERVADLRELLMHLRTRTRTRTRTRRVVVVVGKTRIHSTIG